MFCNKCGSILEENAKFCSKCGCKVDIENQVQETNQMKGNIQNIEKSDSNADKKRDNNVIEADMKKYAIGAIAIPLISILVYYYIGLSLYLAIILAILGLNCSKKAKEYNNTISIVGYVLDIILIAMTGFMTFALFSKIIN